MVVTGKSKGPKYLDCRLKNHNPCSSSSLRLVQFGSNENSESLEFGFQPVNFTLGDRAADMLMAGAHGEEIVRDIYVDAEVTSPRC